MRLAQTFRSLPRPSSEPKPSYLSNRINNRYQKLQTYIFAVLHLSKTTDNQNFFQNSDYGILCAYFIEHEPI